MADPLLLIEDLHVSAIESHSAVDIPILTPIIKGITLEIDRGEIHAIMGPNGSGKSTLANALLGHPGYRVTQGRIVFKGEEITELKPDKRGRAGMFLGFQYPEEIPGISVVNFLRTALSNRTGVEYTVLELRLKVMDAMRELDMDPSFADRYLNEGFSGGERKRNEVLQMTVLEPELAILDETDSGLDIDALRTVAEGVLRLANGERSFLIITHYQRMLDFVTPHFIHVLVDGQIVASGGSELAEEIESSGYDTYRTAPVETVG